ncbi:MAG: hypothetical protein ACFFEY_09995 [Candidatus Thorarchaeota archaeon]
MKISQNTIFPNSCTIFSVNHSNKVLFGNNEDYCLTGTCMWFAPSQRIPTPYGFINTYGCVGFGFKYNNDPADGHLQGGMNDQGLCLDGNGLPTVPLNPHPDLELKYMDLAWHILMECQNVSDVIDWFLSHYLGTSWSCQVHVADASGDAVVVSVGPEREFNFTRKANSHYLVSTNFNLVNYANGYYPCSRYTKACNMLEYITCEENLTVDACREVLDAVHVEGEYGTKYSNIFDLVNLNCHLFYNHNFNQGFTFNLREELANIHPGDEDLIVENGMYFKEIHISSLFIEDLIIPSYLLLLLLIIFMFLSMLIIYRYRTRALLI